MYGLITDRTADNVKYRNTLAEKGWDNMTDSERAEWTGNPLTASEWGYESPINLFPNGPYYSSSVELRYFQRSLVAEALSAGSYLYAVSIIGNAADFEGKTLTLSLGSVTVTGNATPQIALYWHDDSGFEFAGASLSEAGTVTFTVTENTGNRAYLAMYVYASTETSVLAGDRVEYSEVMLEEGDVQHEYVPYTEVLPSPATKGVYNYSDLNRVERCVSELSEKLGLGLTTKTNWNVWDIPKQSDIKRFVDNIQRLRTLYSEVDGIPKAPASLDKLSYSGANDIEKILLAIYENLDGE